MLRRFTAVAPLSTAAAATSARRTIIYKSPRGPLSAEDAADCATKSLSQLWLEACARHGDATAFTDAHSGASLTFRQTANMTRYVSDILASHGIAKGDVVCVFSPNTILYGALCHGALARGATVSPANPANTVEELRRHLLISRAKAVFTVPSTPFEKTALEAVIGLERVVVIPMALPTPSATPFGANDSDSPIEAFSPTATSPNDVALLPFSSGTTGLPKGVQLTNSNISTNCKQITASLGLVGGGSGSGAPAESFLNILPFYHIYGFTAALQVPALAGCPQVVMSKFDLPVYRASIPQHKISHLFIAPPIAVMLAKCPDLPAIDTSSVRLIVSGAAPLAEEVQQQVQPRFPNASIIQGYGLTEASPVTHFTDVRSNKHGAIGPLVHGTEARLVNAKGEDVAEIGRQGELWIRGPQVMRGYLKQEDTDAVFSDDGQWLRTGDIARVDAEGDFFITDRIKELVKYNGLQVPPAELEGILFANPYVRDCLVFGVPDANYGELPMAHVVLAPGVDAQCPAVRADLIECVRSRVANHKQLRGGVRFVAVVPKTASGKLLRRAAKETEMRLRAEEAAAKAQ